MIEVTDERARAAWLGFTRFGFWRSGALFLSPPLLPFITDD